MASCQFLENLTFSSLIAPVTEEEFRARYWEQKPLIVRRGDQSYYGNLFTLEDFDEAITRSPSYVKINEATNKGKGTTIKFSTAKGLEAMLADLRVGATIILENLHHQEPKLGLFCRLLGHELGHIFETNLYLTPPNGRSSVPHWDNTDVFIMQVVGSKHWRIEQGRRIFPIRPYRMGDDVRAFRGDCTSLTLTQGDLLYIPRGFMHVAECGSEASLHISLGLVPVVLEELLHAIIKAAVQRDERLRIALPLGFMQGHGSGVVNGAMAALRNAADEIFVQAVFNQFRDELIKNTLSTSRARLRASFSPVRLWPRTSSGRVEVLSTGYISATTPSVSI